MKRNPDAIFTLALVVALVLHGMGMLAWQNWYEEHRKDEPTAPLVSERKFPAIELKLPEADSPFAMAPAPPPDRSLLDPEADATPPKPEAKKEVEKPPEPKVEPPPPPLPPPPLPPPPVYLPIGGEHGGKGDAINSSEGDKPLIAQESFQTQAFLNRNPRSEGAMHDLPSAANPFPGDGGTGGANGNGNLPDARGPEGVPSSPATVSFIRPAPADATPGNPAAPAPPTAPPRPPPPGAQAPPSAPPKEPATPSPTPADPPARLVKGPKLAPPDATDEGPDAPLPFGVVAPPSAPLPPPARPPAPPLPPRLAAGASRPMIAIADAQTPRPSTSKNDERSDGTAPEGQSTGDARTPADAKVSNHGTFSNHPAAGPPLPEGKPPADEAKPDETGLSDRTPAHADPAADTIPKDVPKVLPDVLKPDRKPVEQKPFDRSIEDDAQPPPTTQPDPTHPRGQQLDDPTVKDPKERPDPRPAARASDGADPKADPPTTRPNPATHPVTVAMAEPSFRKPTPPAAPSPDAAAPPSPAAPPASTLPQSPHPPGASPPPGSGRPGGPSLPPSAGVASDSESDAFVKKRLDNELKDPNFVYQNGRVNARDGRRVKTIKPRFTMAAYADAASMGVFRVTMAARLDATGKVVDVQLIHSSGSNQIDHPSEMALWQWQFEPALDAAGKPHEDVVVITFVGD